MLDGLKNYIARLSKNNFYCSGNFQEELLPGEYIHTYPPPPSGGGKNSAKVRKFRKKEREKERKKGKREKREERGEKIKRRRNIQ